MNSILRRTAVTAAIFIGVVLVMTFAAKLLMRADAAEQQEAAQTADEAKDSPASSDPGVTDLAEGGPSDSTSGDDGADAPAGTDVAAGDSSDGGQSASSETPGPDEGGTAPAPEHVIVIDAAHQSSNDNEKEPVGPGSSTMKAKVNSGATGVASGTPEYRMTLELAQMLRAELEARGYGVYMIRETDDVSISDSERAKTANEKGEIVIHIHGNADEREGIRGIMAFYPTAEGGFVSEELSASCKNLCTDILSELEAATEAKNWGAIAHNGLTALNWTQIPAAHVEVGYLSNPDEDRLLQTGDYRAKLVKGIADGIDLYYGK